MVQVVGFLQPEICYNLARRLIIKNIIPIEVKSKKRYTTNSLDKFTSKYRAKIDSPVVLHTKDLSAKDGVTYLPLYMTPCL